MPNSDRPTMPSWVCSCGRTFTRKGWATRCQASHPHLVAQQAPCAPPIVIDGPVGPVGDKDEDESSSSSLSSDEECGYEQDPGLAALLKVFGTKESFQCAKLFVRNKFSVALQTHSTGPAAIKEIN